MENKSHAIAAVVFLVVFGVGAAVFFFWLSYEQPVQRMYVIVTGESVGGLHPQAAVKFKGLPAGKVKSVMFDPRDPNKVRIVFGVFKDIPITVATYAQLGTKGLAGGKELDLSNPKPGAKALATTKKHPAKIPLHKSLLGQLESSGKQDMHRMNAILDNMHQLLGRDNRQKLSQTIAQVDRATQKLVQAEQAVMPALQQMPAITREAKNNLAAAQKLIAQIQKLATQAKEPVRNASKVEDSVQSLSQSANRLMRTLNDQTLPYVETLMHSIDRSMDRIDRLSRELQAKPQSLLFGPPKARPGPGEPGFNGSRKADGQ